MKTLLEVTRLAGDFLSKKGISLAKVEGEWLVSSALGIKRVDIYTQPDKPLEESELEKIRVFLDRRGKREPLQYILGNVDFLGCSLDVNPSVLIPRPETELLAEKIVNSIKEAKGKVLWDLCTGSGCLGIAIKKHHPELKVILSDNSEKALETAFNNAKKNQVEVECRLGNLLEPFKGEKAHFVVSNPPYVREHEYETLQPEVRNYEPKSALVSGQSGLEFYERFAKELPDRLYPNAAVWLELGPPETLDLFSNPCWTDKSLEKDYSGLPRFLFLNFKEDPRMMST